MDHFKVFIEFVTILLCFMFWPLVYEACGILVPQPGIEPTSPALEGEVLTTGPPGKSQVSILTWLQSVVWPGGRGDCRSRQSSCDSLDEKTGCAGCGNGKQGAETCLCIYCKSNPLALITISVSDGRVNFHWQVTISQISSYMSMRMTSWICLYTPTPHKQGSRSYLSR